MSKKRQSLGKGIEALLGEESLEMLDTPADIHALSSTNQTTNPQPEIINEPSKDSVVHIALDRIQPGPWQPRRAFDQEALQALAASIKAQGVLQPVLVCPYKEGYALIAGERRWRASQLAGLSHIPALVRQEEENANGLMSLIENIQRSDLGPLEVASGLKELHSRGLSHQEVASAIGMARSSVTNTLRLLTLPEQVKQSLQKGEIEMGHAKVLLSLDPDKQLSWAHRITARSLSVRQTEQMVRQAKQPEASKPKAVDPNIALLQQQMTESLGTKVVIIYGQNGKGELRIRYNSTAHFDALLARLTPELHQQQSPAAAQIKPSEPEPKPDEQASSPAPQALDAVQEKPKAAPKQAKPLHTTKPEAPQKSPVKKS